MNWLNFIQITNLLSPSLWGVGWGRWRACLAVGSMDPQSRGGGQLKERAFLELAHYFTQCVHAHTAAYMYNLTLIHLNLTYSGKDILYQIRMWSTGTAWPDLSLRSVWSRRKDHLCWPCSLFHWTLLSFNSWIPNGYGQIILVTGCEVAWQNIKILKT